MAQTYYGAFLILPAFLTERTLPLPCILPFGWTDKLSYAFLYALQFICLQFGVAFAVVGIDILTLSLCLCTSNQYRVLRKCFLIYNTDDMIQINDRLRTTSKVSMKQYDLEKEYLVRLIKHHNVLLRYTRYMNEVLNPFELGHLVISIMGICLGAFVLSMSDISTFDRILATIYLFGFILQLAIDCIVGTDLHYQATLLPDYVFHSDWKLLNDNHLKKDILFVLQTSQRYPQFTAYNLYELNMSTFLKIQKLAFSVYTLLSNMSKLTSKET
ncbi:odorant receptor 59a-like [Diorhabda sublineata]|uniref:odorant receptor 59a-like n=1 Tax=Diorhabda sublineata TaxID=1163346 RepID=UPI0024E15F24|nr:odorant receptor 59a-like [Diorhabda sublineata]